MKNLSQLQELAAEIYPQKTYLEYYEGDDKKSLTYQEFDLQVQSYASYLKAQNFQDGERIAFISPKSQLQIILFFACWKAKLIAVPISEGLSTEETQFILSDSQPSLIVLHQSLETTHLKLCQAETKTISFNDIQSERTELKSCDASAEATAALIYTSGSTGRPKGVMLSHKNLLINGISSADGLPFDSSDRVLSVLPYWHSFALVAEVVMVMHSGASTLIPKDRRHFSTKLFEYQASIILSVPRMLGLFQGMIEKQINSQGEAASQALKLCLSNASEIFSDNGQASLDLEKRAIRQKLANTLLTQIRQFFGQNFRFFIGGGAPLAKEIQVFFKALDLPVYQGYGLSESSPVISCNSPDKYNFGSSGPLLSWLEKENGGDYTFQDDQGKRSKDIHGELLVKGDCVMQGYWHHSDESSKTIDEGWLHTGDIGYLENGYLHLSGRQSNLLCLKGGEKAHPEAIEDLVKQHPAVSEVMVIGEGCKNLYAIINLVDPEISIDLNETKKEIRQICSELASYQVPKNLLILAPFNVEDGTMTPTLKIRRKNIWAKYQAEINNFLASNGENL